MISADMILTGQTGLHARPAAAFVQTASRFQSAVTVHYQGKTANGKSLLSLMSLGIGAAAPFTITADGPDEQEALAALSSLINGLG